MRFSTSAQRNTKRAEDHFRTLLLQGLVFDARRLLAESGHSFRRFLLVLNVRFGSVAVIQTDSTRMTALQWKGALVRIERQLSPIPDVLFIQIGQFQTFADDILPSNDQGYCSLAIRHRESRVA